jgi:superfamily I DNA/RNA helicase
MTRRVWMIGPELLTDEQKQVIALPTDRNQLVIGPPGSGKTVLLLHRAKALLCNLNLSPRRLRVLVFTNVLRTYIEDGAEALHLPFDIVQSFYSWVFQLGEREGLPKSNAARLEDRCKETLKVVTQYFESEHPPPMLDAALVDEGQDLPGEAYRLISRAARHVTVFADYTQRLYSGGANLGDVASSLGVANGAITLVKNLRSSLSVARLAAQFLPAPQRPSYLQAQTVRDMPGTVRIPLLFRAATADEEWERLSEIARQEIASNRRIGILMVDNAMVTSAYDHLSGAGVPAQKITARDPVYADFNELTPKIFTIFSSKGLSFDTVLVPRITRQYYVHTLPRPSQMLFVACTRALDWVYLSTVEGREISELQELTGPVSAGFLAEQRGRTSLSMFSHSVAPEEDAPF